MAENLLGGKGLTSFPYQKRTRAEKGKKFYKACVDAGDTIASSDSTTGIRASMAEKIKNYNLFNDIVDPNEVNNVINPNKLEADFTNDYKNYPLANPIINILLGEERKRFFSPIVTLSNPDLVTVKMNDMTSMLNQFIISQISSQQKDPKVIEQEIQKQAQWATFNYRDRRERMATQILQYGMIAQGMKEEFSRCFEDLLISGEEILITEILAGEPIIRRANPLNIYTMRSGESYKIEDAELIIELGFIPVGAAIDAYHDELKAADIRKLEEGYGVNMATSSGLFPNQLINKEINLESWIDQVGGIGEIVMANKRTASYFGGAFDSQGNVRRIRVVWKGMRKVGVLSYLDENGDLQKKYVDEDYTVDEINGERVEWIWLSEWYEGTKLADDIYVKMGPREVQFRSMDNPSKCYPGIIGTLFNVNSSVAKSLMSLMSPYQMYYNYFMYKLWDEMKTYKGKIAKLSTALIPDGWTMDQFLFYMEQMKIIFENPFNEGNKGAATGKLAGNMNQSSGYVEIGDPQIIQQILLILQFIEGRLADVSGITPQRKGAIENRETVGGIERSVTQSSLSTEKYFGVHDNFRIRSLEAYLETAKMAWKEDKFKRQYILDDGSQAVLDFDGEMFRESEYGVHISTSTSDMEMMQTLRSLVQPFIQNGGSLSMAMELWRTKDPASLQRKLEMFETQVREGQQAAAEQQNQLAAQQMQQEAALEQQRLSQDEAQNIRDNNTKIEIALIQAESKGEGVTETASDTTEAARKDRETSVKEGSLAEQKRKNMATERLKEKDLQIKKTQKKTPSK